MEFCGSDLVCLQSFFDITFWQSFVSDLIATFFGAGLGVLGALSIDKRKKVSEEAEKMDEAAEKGRHATAQIKTELSVNIAELQKLFKINNESKEREVKFDDIRGGTVGVNLQDEVWKAFSAGGELKWIDDRVLLFKFAMAYHSIAVVKSYSDKFFNITYIGGSIRSPVFQRIIKDKLQDVITEAFDLCVETVNYNSPER